MSICLHTLCMHVKVGAVFEGVSVVSLGQLSVVQPPTGTTQITAVPFIFEPADIYSRLCQVTSCHKPLTQPLHPPSP